ncbi:hypothetical protein [Acrocarpospora corrugata]|nr:hypothetical protein [Acrocarpospora corrugata]
MRPRVLAAATAAALLLTMTACDPDEFKPACGLVVDVTGFRKVPAATKLLEGNVTKFVERCDGLAFAAATGRSVGSPCQAVNPVTFPASERENPNGNPLLEKRAREAHIREAITAAGNLLKCEEPQAKGSDVLGALQLIGDRVRNLSGLPGPYQVMIFSDLMNNVDPLDLSKGDYSEESFRKSTIDKLRIGKHLPNFSDTVVEVHGFNLTSEKNPARVAQLQQLWTELLIASGVPADQVRFL